MVSIPRPVRFLTLPVLLFAFGCASSSSAPPVEPTTDSSATVAQPEDPIAESKTAPLQITPVYFATDSATLSDEARTALASQARSILEHPEWGVLTIDGHCDERGSDAYNLALGKQRAKAVERYLVSQGVPPSRLSTRTFGEARPAALGQNEMVWSQNRRSELQFETLTSAHR